MGKFRKRIKYDDIITGEGYYNDMHDKYVYEDTYPDRTTEKLKSNTIDESILSKFDSESQHYQVLNEVNDYKRYGRAITTVDGFIRSSNGNLHRKRKACG